MKILICGGDGVGKTSLLRRLAGNKEFISTYIPTTGVNILDLRLKCNGNSNNIKVKLIDIGSELINYKADERIFSKIALNTEGIFIVIDASSVQSMKDSDLWIDHLTAIIPRKITKFLLMHKADVPNEEKTVTPRNLDYFVKYSDIVEWAYTVGHPDLRDIDYARGSLTKQKAPEDLLRKMVLLILQRRQIDIAETVIFPLQFEYIAWSCVEFEDLDRVDEQFRA